MNILIIDTVRDCGHNQFNTIQIKALVDNGCKVTLVGDNNHFPAELVKLSQKTYTLPPWLYKSFKNSCINRIMNRIMDVLRLLYIRRYIYSTDYNITIFLRYDILTIWAFLSTKTVLLFDHYSACELSNPIKKMFANQLSANYFHLGLNNEICNHIKNLLPQKKVFFIPHGLLKPFRNISMSTIIDKNQKIIFCCATSSCDDDLLRRIIKSPSVDNFLAENKTKIAIKSNVRLDKSENIIILSDFIKDEDYQYLITHSICVFLPYNQSFGYRVSGVMHECIANNIPVICSDIPTFKSYMHDSNPITSIYSEKDFISAVSLYINYNGRWNTNEMDPKHYWNELLTLINKQQ